MKVALLDTGDIVRALADDLTHPDWLFRNTLAAQKEAGVPHFGILGSFEVSELYFPSLQKKGEGHRMSKTLLILPYAQVPMGIARQ